MTIDKKSPDNKNQADNRQELNIEHPQLDADFDQRLHHAYNQYKHKTVRNKKRVEQLQKKLKRQHQGTHWMPIWSVAAMASFAFIITVITLPQLNIVPPTETEPQYSEEHFAERSAPFNLAKEDHLAKEDRQEPVVMNDVEVLASQKSRQPVLEDTASIELNMQSSLASPMKAEGNIALEEQDQAMESKQAQELDKMMQQSKSKQQENPKKSLIMRHYKGKVVQEDDNYTLHTCSEKIVQLGKELVTSNKLQAGQFVEILYIGEKPIELINKDIQACEIPN